MKTLRAIVLLGAFLGLASCGQDGSLVEPQTGPSTILVNGIQLIRVQPSKALALAGQEEVKLVQAKDGQTLSTNDAKLYVHPGSIASDTVIEMRAATDGTMSFTFGPNGLTFSPSATLEIKADKAELTGLDLSRLAVAGASDDVNDWVVIPGSVYDPANNKITVPISHFSRYALCVE